MLMQMMFSAGKCMCILYCVILPQDRKYLQNEAAWSLQLANAIRQVTDVYHCNSREPIICHGDYFKKTTSQKKNLKNHHIPLTGITYNAWSGAQSCPLWYLCVKDTRFIFTWNATCPSLPTLGLDLVHQLLKVLNETYFACPNFLLARFCMPRFPQECSCSLGDADQPPPWTCCAWTSVFLVALCHFS